MSIHKYVLTVALGLFTASSGLIAQEPVVVVGDERATAVLLQPAPEATPVPAVQGQPRVTLICSIPQRLAGPYSWLPVHATLLVVDPNEEFWCPAIEWEVNYEPQGSHGPRCTMTFAEALAEAQGEKMAPWSEKRSFGLQGGGYVYTIKVRLKNGKKVIAFRECEVTVR